MLATIITFSILWPVIWKILLQDKSCNVVNDNITFQYSFLIFLGLILQKGSPYEPNSIAMKILRTRYIKSGNQNNVARAESIKDEPGTIWNCHSPLVLSHDIDTPSLGQFDQT